MTLVLVIAAAVPPITVEVAQAQEAQGEQTVKCPHPKSWTPSAEDLSRILAEHRKWVKGWEDNGSSMQWGLDHPEGMANLCNAFLSKPNLFGENLFMAYLSGAYLIEADLRGANLSAATLIGAKLDNANLYVADLSKANLGEAKLNNAILIGTILTETSLAFADLTKTIYAPALRPPTLLLRTSRGYKPSSSLPGEIQDLFSFGNSCRRLAYVVLSGRQPIQLKETEQGMPSSAAIQLTSLREFSSSCFSI